MFLGSHSELELDISPFELTTIWSIYNGKFIDGVRGRYNIHMLLTMDLIVFCQLSLLYIYTAKNVWNKINLKILSFVVLW